MQKAKTILRCGRFLWCQGACMPSALTFILGLCGPLDRCAWKEVYGQWLPESGAGCCQCCQPFGFLQISSARAYSGHQNCRQRSQLSTTSADLQPEFIRNLIAMPEDYTEKTHRSEMDSIEILPIFHNHCATRTHSNTTHVLPSEHSMTCIL